MPPCHGSVRRTASQFLCLSFVLVILSTTNAASQCILENPSFEIGGSGGAVFGGWNQFGIIGATTNSPPHGAVGARVSGPNTGDWGASGYWQSFDATPGQQWAATVKGWHTSTNPATGQSKGILNIEWRNAVGDLISFESYDVVLSSTAFDDVQEISVTTAAAPTGTVSARIVLMALQGPGQPSHDIFFDIPTFDHLNPPIESIQWDDFPGGRTISFSGRTWRVKGPGFYGPGPNWFTDSAANVWVDASDDLHMTIKSNQSTEVVLEDGLGYGDYVFTTQGQVDLLQPTVVLGIFIWNYPRCFDPGKQWWGPQNETDVEISRWGNPSADVAQFVVQPFDWPGNIQRFDHTYSVDELVSYAFNCLPDRVEFRAWQGGPQDESPPNMITSWTYTGPQIPRMHENPRVHINLWHFEEPNVDQEAIIDEFTFVPMGGPPTAIRDDVRTPQISFLSEPRPNPFNPSTTFSYTIKDAANTEITVYDVRGRRVRALVNAFIGAGEYTATWDGRNDSGQRVASGVYLYQLRSGSVVETKRMVLLK